MIDATAIIMTKNEEKNIVDCLKSMKGFAKRCVVIDCGSTDKTVELAKANGADVYIHEFEYYAKQFNWGLDNTGIDTEWVIRLDADERFPKKLCDELEQLIRENADKPMNGIMIQADLYFMNRCLKHGGRKKCKMMLFKRACGRIEDRRRDAHSVISEGFTVDAKNRFLHYDFKDLDTFIKRYNWYATREMQDYIDFTRGVTQEEVAGSAIKKTRYKKFGVYYKFPKFIRCWLLFIYVYIFRLGFLDGKAGLMYAYFDTYWYRFLVDAKICEYEAKGGEFEKLTAFN